MVAFVSTFSREKCPSAWTARTRQRQVVHSTAGCAEDNQSHLGITTSARGNDEVVVVSGVLPYKHPRVRLPVQPGEFLRGWVGHPVYGYLLMRYKRGSLDGYEQRPWKKEIFLSSAMQISQPGRRQLRIRSDPGDSDPDSSPFFFLEEPAKHTNQMCRIRERKETCSFSSVGVLAWLDEPTHVRACVLTGTSEPAKGTSSPAPAREEEGQGDRAGLQRGRQKQGPCHPFEYSYS